MLIVRLATGGHADERTAYSRSWKTIETADVVDAARRGVSLLAPAPLLPRPMEPAERYASTRFPDGRPRPGMTVPGAQQSYPAGHPAKPSAVRTVTDMRPAIEEAPPRDVTEPRPDSDSDAEAS